MRMIVVFAWRVLHRPVPRHPRAAGTDERVEVHMRRAGEAVFREQLAADFHAHFVRALLHFYRRESGQREDGECGEKRDGETHGRETSEDGAERASGQPDGPAFL